MAASRQVNQTQAAMAVSRQTFSGFGPQAGTGERQMISNARRKAARRRTLDVVRQAFAYRGERAVDVAAEILGAGQDQEGNPNGEDGVLDRGDRGLVAQEEAEHREGLSLGRYWVVRVDGGRGSLICGKGEGCQGENLWH